MPRTDTRLRPSYISTETVRLRVAAGTGVIEEFGLPPRTQRAVALAGQLGAPMIETLDAALAAEEDARRASRAIQVAVAQTRIVAGGLVLAPVVLVPAISRLAGVDLWQFYSSSFGLLVLAVGALLIVMGALLVLGLVRRVSHRSHGRAASTQPLVALAGGALAWWIVAPVVGIATAGGLLWLSQRRSSTDRYMGIEEAADLIATARSGGTTTSQALRATADQLPEVAPALRRLAFDLDFDQPAQPESGSTSELARLEEVLRTAEELGAPISPALRRLATDLRADDLARALAAAERLPAQLTFPTALCLLPATVLLIGAPIVHTGLAGFGA